MCCVVKRNGDLEGRNQQLQVVVDQVGPGF